MEIKEKIKELRKSKGLTQLQISNLLNISKTGYASWEQGLAEPNIQYIKKMCVIFDVSADELLDIDDYQYTFEYNHADTKLIHREKRK